MTGPVPLGDLVGHSDDHLAAVERRALLDDVLGQLPERERRILQLRFVEDLTQAEIADHLGVNQMYVSRALARILARLRHLVDPS